MSKLVKQFTEDTRGQRLYKQEGAISLLCLVHFAKGWFKSYGYVSRYYDFDFVAFISVVEEELGAVFFSHDIYKRTTRDAYGRFVLTNGGVFEELLGYNKCKSAIASLYEEYAADRLRRLSEEQLLGVLGMVLEQIPAILAATVFSESLDEELVGELYEQAGGDDKPRADFRRAASLVGFDSYASKFDQALLDFVQNGNVNDVQWVLCDYYVAPAIGDVPQLLNDIVKQRGGKAGIEKDRDRLARERKANNKEIAAYKEKLTGKLLGLFEFVQLTMQVRDVRKEYFQKMFTVLSNLAREMFRRQGLPEEDVVYAVTDELVSGKYKERDYGKKLKQRKPGVVAYVSNNGWQVECGGVGRARRELEKLVHGVRQEGVGEFRGSTAYPGLARGKVSVISSKKDLGKFIPGSVLVTSMTRPEFLPIMKQAVAVVTDEGGITCHAAIASRELKIPCVIGTKVATQVLRDGDLVEVDAERGIIKKL